MSTRFTALTVREGDAFLLEDNGWTCLFDSGVDGSIVDLLKFKGINKLDLAICSHNDSDHANGFIELFNNIFQIDEIWLPGIWANVLQFVKEACVNCREVEWERVYYNEEPDLLLSNESVDEKSFNQDLAFLDDLAHSEKIDEFHVKLAYYLTANPDVIYHYSKTLFNADLCGEQVDCSFIKAWRAYH